MELGARGEGVETTTSAQSVDRFAPESLCCTLFAPMASHFVRMPVARSSRVLVRIELPRVRFSRLAMFLHRY